MTMAFLARTRVRESKHQYDSGGWMVWFGPFVIDFRTILLELEAGPSNIKIVRVVWLEEGFG
jgi:hypothetical protein